MTTVTMNLPIVLLLTLFSSFAHSQLTIEPDEFAMGNMDGLFDAIIDVRTADEWLAGHIENATFVENLATMTSIPATSDILGCEGQCEVIVVYCRSGNRAGVAIDLLLESGFNGTIYNGLGTSQWTAAGYPLVTTESVLPKCSAKQEATKRQADDGCRVELESEVPTVAPVYVVSIPPVDMTLPDMPSVAPVDTTASGMPSMVESIVNTGMPTVVTEQEATTAMPTEEPTSDGQKTVVAGTLLLASLLVAIVGLY